MGAYPQSGFEVEPEVVQRDMKVEWLFGNRGMLIEDTLVIVARLKGRVARSVALIDDELRD